MLTADINIWTKKSISASVIMIVEFLKVSAINTLRELQLQPYFLLNTVVRFYFTFNITMQCTAAISNSWKGQSNNKIISKIRGQLLSIITKKLFYCISSVHQSVRTGGRQTGIVEPSQDVTVWYSCKKRKKT